MEDMANLLLMVVMFCDLAAFPNPMWPIPTLVLLHLIMMEYLHIGLGGPRLSVRVGFWPFMVEVASI